jgi:hypothetical protein
MRDYICRLVKAGSFLETANSSFAISRVPPFTFTRTKIDELRRAAHGEKDTGLRSDARSPIVCSRFRADLLAGTNSTK